ncbi:MAG: hypothetical protein IJD85_03305, partial [Oscillospiraceae bacterium]|nr:hypothetical protein [Oscillospiraceae bacterium]
QLTGDDSYKTQSGTYSISTLMREDDGAALGISQEYAYYYEIIPTYSPLSDLLNEVKPYVEANIDEMNEFFEANQSEAIKKRKAEGDKYYPNFVDVDWFPDTITTTNDSGTYKLTLTKASIGIAIASSTETSSTDMLISDFYIENNPTLGGNVVIHTNSVYITFFGSIEKIS